jgi:hypothetical protein
MVNLPSQFLTKLSMVANVNLLTDQVMFVMV